MNQLALFAKFWQPGRVKTRLAVDLGEKLACRVYQFFLSHLINQLSRSAEHRTIVYSPLEREAEFRAAAGVNWQLQPQVDGDLGGRMQQFFEDSFESNSVALESETNPADRRGANQTLDECGVKKTVIVGSDCPSLSHEDIELAFVNLDREPVVLGPSDDGGYYLIGMRNECVRIFDDIDWSTDRVLSQTRSRLKSLKIGWSELDQKSDIDTLDDLMKFQTKAMNNGGVGHPMFVLFSAIEGALAEHRREEGKV